MTRQSPALPAVAPAEARYFQLLAVGPDDEPEAQAPPIHPVSEPRAFSLMAIGILDEEPAGIDLWRDGRNAGMKVLVRGNTEACWRHAASRPDRVTTG